MLSALRHAQDGRNQLSAVKRQQLNPEASKKMAQIPGTIILIFI